MKKYLLGITAIAMAISLSAYTAPKGNIIKANKKNKNSPFDLWWFKVNPGFGMASGFTNGMVEFIEVSPYMPEYICNVWPWTWKCTIGFDILDVDETTNRLSPGPRYPFAIGELRPDY